MSTVVKDLGAVSAYAYAVEKGYTGTEAEFAELMADYAEVGQRAEDAAESALNSKTSAQTAANTATTKASEATTAATTAANKAAEAQADADAAALDASQAMSAASTATTKATEATTAAATATSAASTATTAKDDAVSAKTAAQTAQTGAETAAASVQSSAAQIATNTSDINELKEDLNSITEEIDGIAIPYNLYNADTCIDNKGLVSADGTVTDNSNFWITDFLPLRSLVYIVSNYTIYKVCFYDSNKGFLAFASINNPFATIPTNAMFARVQFNKSVVQFGTTGVVIVCSDSIQPEFLEKSNIINKDHTLLDVTLGDLSFGLRAYVKTLGALLTPEWELGTIDGTTGKDGAGTLRIRTKGYIPLEAFYAYSNSQIPTTILFAYDVNYTYLGRCYNGFSAHYYSRDEALSLFPTAKFFRILFPTDSFSLAEDTLIFGNEIAYKAWMAYAGLNSSGYAYYGKKICIKKHSCEYGNVVFSGTGQDGVFFNGYFFACGTDGKVTVKNTNNGNTVTSINLDKKDTILPHCNTAVWGNKYNDTDTFPLLYINAYNTSGLPKGTCYVHRITDSNGVPQTPTELIQTITIGFANEEPWTSGNDIRPYGNFFVDTEGGYLWAYTLKDSISKTRFFKFALPNISITSVTLSASDILEQFDVPYMPFVQGNTYHNGNVYILNGYGTESVHGGLNVVNLDTKTIDSRIDLNKIGLSIEPEFVIIDDNNDLILGQGVGYKFEF